ncbi:MAG: hypothetical protein AVDCRST_MAG78-333 [uncultured Rubrobacteraceae bacterium]|uniref:DUF1990 domain-containing protein n=1 Tax=uncultured Rubrobacteraceae bacterium TaxID=349277 RepID=A0A6J4PBI8_9ACTN|nr:MAG: hypothetical protein AVDCRST_MAG78-333 [uncultured Rubrobacteraceae bacterium]
MFLLRNPSQAAVRRFISSQENLPFSYENVGASREGAAPSGYVVDRYRVRLGEGPEAYARAVEALRAWRQFDLRWVRLLPPHAPIEVGVTVGVLARHYGFWSLNTARIAYLIEETGQEVERFGFGYGTLPGHAERGEERFGVEWNRTLDGSVHYDVFAFSRPKHPLAWPGYPFARLLQKRFRRDSTRAMVEAVTRGKLRHA